VLPGRNDPRAGRRTVTVLLVGYEQARFAEHALDAIAAQTATDFQLIVTDDGSVDGTAGVVRGWAARHPERPLTLLANPRNVGLLPTLNAALRLVEGRYLAAVAMDDLWGPRFLEARVGALERRLDAAVAYSDARLIDPAGELIGGTFSRDRCGHEGPLPQSPRELVRRLATGNMIPAPSAVIRTDAFRSVGGAWDLRLSFEDWDLWLRLARAGHSFVALEGDSDVSYRVVPGQMSTDVYRKPEHVRTIVRTLAKARGLNAEADSALRRTSLEAVRSLRRHATREAVAPLLEDALRQRRPSTAVLAARSAMEWGFSRSPRRVLR